MIAKILNHFKNKGVNTIIGIFLFFVPSFSDLKKLVMEQTLVNGIGIFASLIPNFITGGILVFLFILYRNTLLKNEEIIKDLEMMRFIADYRRDHMQLVSMGAQMHGISTPLFFTDTDYSSGTAEYKYDSNEKNAAIQYFIHEKGLLAKDAELIIKRYYEHNTGYRKISN
ncbi:MAG TPA: hypothetical protein PLW44_01680 [Chitinophagales bacterium]|nr:hypothetical protein [Chitinophagales bacterium]